MTTMPPRPRTALRLDRLEDRCTPTAGALDPTFGAGGVATTALSPGWDRAYAVAVQPDGKILVGGEYNGNGSIGAGDFAVARYLPDGTLDTTFGTGGRVTTDFFGSRD